MPKQNNHNWVALLIALIFVVLLPVFLIERQVDPTIRIGGQIYELEIADEPVERAKGLSGRESLELNAGMFFVFEATGFHTFWMRDMNFPLDIIWINEDLEVVHIERDLQPESYPQTYVSHLPARYVLEVNAGEMFANGVQVGSEVKISGVEL